MADAKKPVLIFDGKCSFCRIWIDYWKHLTGDAVEYAPSQEVGPQYPQIPPENFKRSVQLVLPDGEFYQGAEAVLRTLAYDGSRKWPLGMYRNVPGVAPFTEAFYRFIAANRNFAYRVTVLLFGRQIEPSTYRLVEWVFGGVLSLIFVIAFLSFGTQAPGLIGSQGVLPVSAYLQRAHEYLGSKAYFALPTLLWLNSSDAAIRAVWLAGALCSLVALFGVFRRAALFAAWILYLSLLSGSQEFLSFQWDILLLETGLLAVFIGYSRVIVWMFRWLLFRLMFLSGAVKLLSGDPTWSTLHAMSVHFQTQPIPTPLAWYAHQLPEWAQRASTGMVLLIELLLPLCVLGPRRVRLFAAPWLIGLQVLILLTGNYAFFNWLTLALCLFLFNDASLARFVPKRRFSPQRNHRRIAWAVALILGVLSASHMWQTFTGRVPVGMQTIVAYSAPFGITSSYGLFATMTTRRGEIVVEGSNDGETWQEYEFPYKPGRLDRRPPWVAPHQPRLDWQMWFAALGVYQQNGWFINMAARLLQGSPSVTALLERNPFPNAPPKYIRAQLYEYTFTTWGDRNWWTRRFLGPYLPPVSLESFQTSVK
jgi:lipase maturation factor 1